MKGGTELYVDVLARGLSKQHEVHVITPDLDEPEQRGPTCWWWGPQAHPTKADAVIAVHNLQHLHCDADLLVLASNGIGADMAGLEDQVDAVAVFSECHADLLAKSCSIPKEKYVVTGLGIDTMLYPQDDQSVPGRLFVGNDPQRGLWHVLDIFDLVRKEVPGASLHVGYDFDRSFEQWKWSQTAMGEMMWECRERIDKGDGIVNRGALTTAKVILELIEQQVHVWPSDPPNVGSQIHGITQMESAAAGAALVLSDIEAFPEVFGDGAEILPVIGRYFSREERRVDAADYAEVVVRLMKDPRRYATMRKKAQRLAAKNQWKHVIARWMAMLDRLQSGVAQEDEDEE